MLLSMADNALEYVSPNEQGIKRAANLAKYDRCQNEAANSFDREFQAQKEYIPTLLAVDLTTLLTGWLIIWLGIVITRWVRRGFASS